MEKYSKKMQYEKALAIRNQIEALTAVIGGARSAILLRSDLSELKEKVGLKIIPARIEAFDISNISGYGAVGSMVTFLDAKPSKSDYRRFRIKTVIGADDYAMLKEVVRRRYSRVVSEKKKLADLIMVDGGKGQLNAAIQALQETGIKIPAISIAKNPDRVFVENKKEPVDIPTRSNAFKLIQRIRDEAHRFAISYQKIVRKKKIFDGE
jgi:excinuclease ABC subunit C